MLISHSYAEREQIQEYADQSGLLAEFLPWSWYNPAGCIAVAFSRKPAITGAA
jgi:hypothetical protein